MHAGSKYCQRSDVEQQCVAGTKCDLRGCVAAPGCSLPCLMSWEQLEALCRREKLSCQQLGVNRANLNNYEVEFLCDYKKNKVSPESTRPVICSPMVCKIKMILL